MGKGLHRWLVKLVLCVVLQQVIEILVVKLRLPRQNDEGKVDKSQGVEFIGLMHVEVAVGEGDVAEPYGFVEQVQQEGAGDGDVRVEELKVSLV